MPAERDLAGRALNPRERTQAVRARLIPPRPSGRRSSPACAEKSMSAKRAGAGPVAHRELGAVSDSCTAEPRAESGGAASLAFRHELPRERPLRSDASPERMARTRPSRTTATRAQWRTRSPSRWVIRRTIRPDSRELAHLAEQLVGLGVGQRRIGLVEQEHPRVARDGARDLGPLLHGERAFAERTVAHRAEARSRP